MHLANSYVRLDLSHVCQWEVWREVQDHSTSATASHGLPISFSSGIASARVMNLWLKVSIRQRAIGLEQPTAGIGGPNVESCFSQPSSIPPSPAELRCFVATMSAAVCPSAIMSCRCCSVALDKASEELPASEIDYLGHLGHQNLHLSQLAVLQGSLEVHLCLQPSSSGRVRKSWCTRKAGWEGRK